jgi:voltage-gated sodium channel
MAASSSAQVREDLLKNLECTCQALGDQERLACGLAKMLAKLRAETEELLAQNKQVQPEVDEHAEEMSELPGPLSKKEMPKDGLTAGVASKCTSTDDLEGKACKKQNFASILPGSITVDAEGTDALSNSLGMKSRNEERPLGLKSRSEERPRAITPQPKRAGTDLMSTSTMAQFHAFNSCETSSDRIFLTPEELKDHIRKKLETESYDPRNFYKETGCAQTIARTTAFEVASVILLIASSVYIAVAMDHNDAATLHESAVLFQVFTHGFCLCFLLEAMVRIMAFRHIRYAFMDFWVTFDTLLVSFLIIETWVLGTISAVSGSSFTEGRLKTVVAFRVLRLFRLLRVLRLVRLLRHVPQLMVIVRGLGIALRSVACVLILLLIIIYAGAIVCKGLFEGSPFGKEWFPTVMASMGTLMLECTLSGSRGTGLMREAYTEHPVYAFLLLLFVLLSNVTMMGILAGILVQTVRTVAEVEKEDKTFGNLVKTIKNVWNMAVDIDSDGDGTVSAEEFGDLIKRGDTARVMHAMDVDVEGLISLSGFIFDQNQGRLGRQAFLQMVLDFRRGNKKATVKDHMETRKFIRSEFQTLESHLS